MALKIKRQFPYTEREFNVRTPLDDKFDVAEKALDKANAQAINIAKSCLFQATRKVIQAARLFDASDPSVHTLISLLQTAVKNNDIEGICIEAKTFVSQNPIERLSPGTPEHSLLYALANLIDGCLYLSPGDEVPVPAYHSTVTCQSALRFVGE